MTASARRCLVWWVLPALALQCKTAPPPTHPQSDPVEAASADTPKALADPIRLEPFHVRAETRTPDGTGVAIEAYDAGGLFERAGAAFDQKRFAEAGDLYGQIVDEFPSSPLVPPALYNRGLAKEQLRDYQGAVTDYQRLVSNHPDSRDVKDALFRIAGAYESLEAWEDAVAAFDTLLDGREDLEGIERVECLARQGAALIHLEKPALAEASLHQAIALFRRRAGISPSESTYFSGMAHFKLGEITGAKMHAAPLPADESKLEAALEKKCQLLLDAQSRYTMAIRDAHPHWAAAAAYRIGHLYRVLWDDLLNAPVPPNLDEEEKAIYRDILKQRIRVLLTKAVRQWERVLKMASRLELQNEWVDRTKADLEEVRRLLVIGEATVSDEQTEP